MTSGPTSHGSRKLNLESLEQRHLLAQLVEAPGDIGVHTESDHQHAAIAVRPQTEMAANHAAFDNATEISPIELPLGLPKAFSADVVIDGEIWTLDLEKHSVFGENTRFLVDDGTGELVEIDRGEDTSYIGGVSGRSDFVVGAQLTDAGLIASLVGSDGQTITIEPASFDGERSSAHRILLPAGHYHPHDEHHDHRILPADLTRVPAEQAAFRELSDKDESGQASGGATLPPDFVVNVLEYEVGVEIGSASFLSSTAYNGNLMTAQASAASVATNMDARFLHGSGIKHTIGTVIIRTTTGTDPLRTQISSANSSGLAAFRDYWNGNPGEVGTSHDLAVYHVASPPSGIAYVNSVGTSNRYALSAGNGATSWANGTVVHEFGHSWNLRHVGDTPIFYESKPRNFSGSNSAGGEDVFVSVMHGGGDHNIGRLATDEAQVVLDAKANKTQFGTAFTAAPTKPFGHRDEAFVGANPIVIDVVANDYDANNDVLDVQLLDTVSQKGATISLSVGTGPGGRSEIIYTPPAVSTGEVDFFHYTVIDSTGRTDWAAVYVDTTEVSVNLTQDDYAYDFGTTDSPIFSNTDVQAVRISPETTGDVLWSDIVQAVDYPSSGQNNYNRDLVFGSQPVTWSHPVQNGRWNVIVNMSDPGFDLDNMYVDAEGQPGLTNLDRPIGQNQTVSFQVDVLDGELNLTFGDADNQRWAINRVVLEQVTEFLPPLLPGDYNGNGLVDAADFTVWRDSLGQSVAVPYDGADGDGDAVIDTDDYNIWQTNFGLTLVSTPLIDATTGNGEFAVDSAGDVSVFGGGTSTPVIDLSRDRALRSDGVTGRGISILGWDIERVGLSGGNAAFGADGLYGFAPNPGTGPGQTGQAFVNSGSVLVRSNPISHSFAAGDQIDLSYLLGSDTGVGSTVQSTVSLIFNEGLATEQTYDFDSRSAVDLTTPAITEQFRLVSDATTVSIAFLLDGGTSVRALLDKVELNKVEPGSILPPVAGTPLIDATLGNGSFEDQTGATGTNVSPPLVMARDETATIPGWTATTVLVGGWNGGITGAATDGAIYAFAASEAELTLTSAPVNTHTTAAGDEFQISFDAGSSNGTLNYYEVRLVFGGSSRLVGSVFEAANVTTTGAVRHEFSYTATGADAGAAPVLEFYVENNGNFSQAFIDSVELAVVASTIVEQTPAAFGTSTPEIAGPLRRRMQRVDETRSPISAADEAWAQWEALPRVVNDFDLRIADGVRETVRSKTTDASLLDLDTEADNPFDFVKDRPWR